MIIGIFQEEGERYTGHLRTLTLDAPVAIVPAAPGDAANAPAFRVMLEDPHGGVEIGAAWERRGERAGSYLALQIDDPALGGPLRANLLRSPHGEGEHILLWSRTARSERS